MDVSRVEYKEDKENRVVVAKISGIRDDAINKINDNFVNTVTSKIYFCDNWDREHKYTMPYSLKAVARCMDGDEYSYEKGKQIALKKLTEKYNRSVDKRIFRFLKDMDLVLKNIDKYFEGRTF